MSAPNRYTEGLVEIADAVASTTATNGEIRFNLGNSTTGSGIASDVCFWGTDGFLSRPIDPDANGSAQMLFINDGNQRRIIGSRDRRNLSTLEALDPGDRMIYGPSGIRIRLDDSSRAVEIRIPGGTVMSLEDDSFSIQLAGGASLTLTNTGFEVSLPTPIPSGISIDSTGAVISAKNIGQTIHLDAFSFVTLGLTAGITRPFLASVENVNIGPGGGITLPSPKVFAASV